MKDYRGAFKDLPPLFVRWRSAGMERCARLTFTSGATFDADGTSVTSFGWEPVTRTRLIAVDGPEGPARDRARRPAVASPGKCGSRTGSRSSLYRSGERAVRGRRRVGLEGPGRDGRSFASTSFAKTAAAVALAAPRLQVRPGTPFSFRSGIEDAAGQTREVIVSGYLSVDGRSVVAVARGDRAPQRTPTATSTSTSRARRAIAGPAVASDPAPDDRSERGRGSRSPRSGGVRVLAARRASARFRPEN